MVDRIVRNRFVGAGVVLALALSTLLDIATVSPAAAVTTTTSGTTVTQTFDYSGAVETMTVPSNVTAITVTIKGGEGGRGGNDSAGRPPTGGYKGVVSGTVTVNPGDLLTIAVGQGGADSSRAAECAWGASYTSGGVLTETDDPAEAVGGTNPLGGYRGGNGGAPGQNGCSGYGGSGGAASVLMIGTSDARDAVATIVAGGSGGSGGSGQWSGILGRISLSSHSARTDTTTTLGQDGLYVYALCRLIAGNGCDGGGGAGGGGGVSGGARGLVEFGAGSNTEWFGHGGNPGGNSTSGIAGLNSSYDYYSTNNGDGSIVITYSNGVPGQATAVTSSAGNASASVYWTAPTVVGNGPITNYVVETSTGDYSSWSTYAGCSGTTTNCAVTGLTNGAPYKFRVTAVNDTGAGSPSVASAAVTPSGPPAAPTIDSVTAGDGQLEVAFTAPASSLAITNYQYSVDSATTWVSAGVASSPLTISGLLNGTVYAVRIRAISAAGTGDYSAATNAVPSALPGAPTITNVTAPNGTSLSVTFVAGYTGGSSITDYEYATSVGENTSNFGAYVSAGLTSPFTISGLSSGTTYTVQLRAKNSAGTGPGSAYRTGVTLAPPNLPVVNSIARGDQKLIVTYAAYDTTTDGGSPISKMEYSVDSGTTWVNAGTLANPFTISGLTNGTTYNVRLRATNAVGTSGASTIHLAVPAGVPSSPRQVQVSAAPAGATVSWVAPLSGNGAAVESYTVSAYTADTGGSAVSTCTTSGLTCEVASLSNGTTYYFDVKAINAIGSSAASSPRLSAVPAALPGAPTINSITAGNAYLSVAFTAGTADANAPITGYQYSFNNGTSWSSASGSSSPLLLTGLSNGTSYSVRIRATSSVGSGAQSNAVSGTPYTVPDAVDANSISYTAGAGEVTVTWAAANANGNAISSYDASAFTALTGGSVQRSCSTSSTSCTITGLSNGTTYYVSIQSQNSAGYSPRSVPRVAVRPGTSSTTGMTVSVESATVGTSLIFTATVTPGATGSIDFTSNGTSITGCSAVSIVSDTATCTTTALAVGTNSVRANYSGDGTYASSASSASSIVIRAITQMITFAALSNRVLSDGAFTVSASGGASGNAVTFTSATTSICTATGTNGTTITPRAAGTCMIRANQAGNTNYGAADQVERSFAFVTQYTVQFNEHGAAHHPANVTYTPGVTVLTLPTETRTSYVLEGWYDAATGGNRAGSAGDTYEPSASMTLHARWVQASLWGMGTNIKIGTMTTTTGLGTSYSASSGVNRVDIQYPADALPAGTVIDMYLLMDTTRAQRLIAGTSNFATNLVVAWKATDESVPTTAAGKPLTMTITNPGIRAGATIYSLLGDSATVLGTASEDGSVTIELTDDPEIVITSSAPAAPTNVVATAGAASASISWTAPASNGGATITSYIVESNGVQVCAPATTSCTASGLTNGTSYTFTVKAVNAVGTSAPSAASAAVTPTAGTAGGTGGATGGGSGSGGSPTPTTDATTTVPALRPIPTLSQLVTDFIGYFGLNNNPIALLDNRNVDPIVMHLNNAILNVQVQNSFLNFSSQLQNNLSPLLQNAITAQLQSQLLLSGSGMYPGTSLTFSVFSTRRLLATTTVDDKGNFTLVAKLPAGLERGDHTLQVSGVTANKEVFAVAVPMKVQPTSQTAAKRILFLASGKLSSSAASNLRTLVARADKGTEVTVTVVPRVTVGTAAKAAKAAAKQRALAVVNYLKKLGVQAKYSIAPMQALSGAIAKKNPVDIRLNWMG